MPYRYALAEHGRTLATRPLGSELRAQLAEEAAEEQAVTLDFSGVLSVSHSFADEFMGKLAEEIDRGEVPFSARFVGVTPEVERVVRKALERRDVAIPAAA